MIDVLVILLALSVSANVALVYFLKKKSKVKLEKSYDVQMLLRDLASGPALLKVEYLDRADVLLRSPRHM